MNVQYDIGHPMTFDEMQAFKAAENNETLTPSFETGGERFPHLFEDEAVGNRSIALISIISPDMDQKHEDGCMYMKIKTVCNSLEDAQRLGSMLPNEQTNVYAVEIFKFNCMPPMKNVSTQDESDTNMNNALRAYLNVLHQQEGDFNERKKQMLEDIARQETVKKEIRDGIRPESDLDSSCIFPEPLAERVDVPKTNVMQSDPPSTVERFAVLCTADLTHVDCELTGHMIFKICSVHEKSDDAETHMKELKKQSRYKPYDLSVVHMYEWLKMPPPVELLDNVCYSSSKLTEVLGERKKTININQTALQQPASV